MVLLVDGVWEAAKRLRASVSGPSGWECHLGDGQITVELGQTARLVLRIAIPSEVEVGRYVLVAHVFGENEDLGIPAEALIDIGASSINCC